MIIEYNFKYNDKTNKTHLQSRMYDMSAKEQLLLLFKITNLYFEIIKPSIVYPYMLFRRISIKGQKQQEVKNK
jgi:hypothetical protein